VLDLKLLRQQPEWVRQRLATRGITADLESILELDRQCREWETQRSAYQSESNTIGKQVGEAKRAGADPETLHALRERGTALKTLIADLEAQERQAHQAIEEHLLTLPNLPQEVVPVGASEADNVEIRRWGDEYKPSHAVLPHDEMAEKLGWLESSRAVKIAQSRFIALKGLGAALERALIDLMLSRHIQAGYTEYLPPLLVNSHTLKGTGQLPKFAEESFRCAQDDLWLIPTAEVPLTNLYQGEIIPSEQLPLNFCAFTPCFRREAGSYGRDMKGLIRLHQFHKVELVKITHPEQSQTEHENLVRDAEAILQLLELPYRVMELCTADLGFSASRCYDLEVWFPSSQTYREISSCSNCWDFQARRADIRCKDPGQKGTQFVHTLNGSALAVGRTMAALLENYQRPDGSLGIPKALQDRLQMTHLEV